MNIENPMFSRTVAKLGDRIVSRDNRIQRLELKVKRLERKIRQLEWELGK